MQTAEEFLTDKYKAIYYRRPEGFTSKVPEHAYLRLYVSGRIDGVEQNYPEMMIEFAKLHVEAALEAVNMKATAKVSEMNSKYATVDEDSILNAYPLTNIK